MHVGYKNSHCTCDHQISVEFQTKNLADLQIKYYWAAQAGISICCLHTLCFEISIASDVFKNNRLLFPWNTIWSASAWNIALFLHGDMFCGTTKTKCYSARGFYKAPPSLQQFAGCWCHSSLAKTQPGCPGPVWKGRVGLAHLCPWVELYLCRTQLCVFLRVKQCQVRDLCSVSSENPAIDWLGKILTSASSQAVVRGESSVHINQFV